MLVKIYRSSMDTYGMFSGTSYLYSFKPIESEVVSHNGFIHKSIGNSGDDPYVVVVCPDGSDIDIEDNILSTPKGSMFTAADVWKQCVEVDGQYKIPAKW